MKQDVSLGQEGCALKDFPAYKGMQPVPLGIPGHLGHRWRRETQALAVHVEGTAEAGIRFRVRGEPQQETQPEDAFRGVAVLKKLGQQQTDRIP